jgi:predicted TIM-barrel fold metal-dependent hydrolase
MASTTILADYRKNKPSRSAQLKARLNHPVIDTDLHTFEFLPLLEDYIDKFGGAQLVDKFRNGRFNNRGNGRLSSEKVPSWYDLTDEERAYYRIHRPAFWILPAKNTLDLATVGLPRLLVERLDDQGTDFAVLYPNVVFAGHHTSDPEERRALIRAINTYHADVYRPYADRVTPVAAIPLDTPEEGIEELEYAVKVLGLKSIIIPGAIHRPISALQERYPFKFNPLLAQHGTWLDTFGLDSAYDYDPFWAKTIELGVNPTTHFGSQGSDLRSSITNYTANHIGHFAAANDTLVRSLFFGGVTNRLPQFRIGLLEGGAAWGASLYNDIILHWNKRNGETVHNYNPNNVNYDQILKLYREYGSDLFAGKTYSDEQLKDAIEQSLHRSNRPQDAYVDDFALTGVKSHEDIRDRFVPNFFLGSEADDPSIAAAFNSKANALGVKLNAFWSSDSGHWDVPDLTNVLSDSWALVERGAITEEDFHDLVFGNPYKFYTANNPNFFDGTVIESKVKQRKSA